MTQSILVVNCGSSSLKLALFDENENKLASAIAERLNGSDAFARLDGDDRTVPLPRNANHKQALTAWVLSFPERKIMPPAATPLGLRVVHDGETFRGADEIEADVAEPIN